MNTSRPQLVRKIFMDVVELAADQRPAALVRLCAGDDALRAEVQILLDADQAAGNFMASPTASAARRPTAELPITEAVGTTIGPYKLLELIGEGGFGSVFMAEQRTPVARKVALKIIKLGMDTKAVAARFDAERQALAMMDHPHIARVFDGGITPITESGGGRPYFVMEYVRGTPITPFAREHRLSIGARLDLFMQVCLAVQHAHTKGIIHRDLKPANVLVSMVDGKPFAKVIDFGIAKSLAARLTEQTLFTEHRMFIGTPEYMSPEQAEGSPDIDTRADIYGLGVLLYELLTGLTPFDGTRLRSAAYQEMQRIIKEEDPPKPSLRVTQGVLRTPMQRMEFLDSGGTASDESALRPDSSPADPAAKQTSLALSRRLQGELDWIVMKALDKDRTRRYETASAFADDIGRHLAGEPVVAAPPSAGYRLRKFVRKHRGPVIAGSAIAAVLLIGIAGTTWQWSKARRANDSLKKIASTAFTTAESVFSSLWSMKDAQHRFASPEAYAQPSVTEQMVITASPPGGTFAVAFKDKDDPSKGVKFYFDSSPSYPGEGLPIWAQPSKWPALSFPLRADVNDEELAKAVRLMDAIGRAMKEASGYMEGSLIELLRATDAAEWSSYSANMFAAQAAMTACNWTEARQLVAACPVRVRGWEWRFQDLQVRSTLLDRKEITTSPYSAASLSLLGREQTLSRILGGRSLPRRHPRLISQRPLRPHHHHPRRLAPHHRRGRQDRPLLRNQGRQAHAPRDDRVARRRLPRSRRLPNARCGNEPADDRRRHSADHLTG
jgi:serine/threonine protein kinase